MTKTNSINGELEELRKEYIDGILSRLKILKRDIENKNIYGIVHFAHKLKGSGASFGFPELSELGQEIENVFKDAKWDELDILYEDLSKTIKKSS